MSKEEFYDSLEQSKRTNDYKNDLPAGIYKYAEELLKEKISLNKEIQGSDSYIVIYPLTPKGEIQFQEESEYPGRDEVYSLKYNNELFNVSLFHIPGWYEIYEWDFANNHM